jgi:hypothetical protein
VTEIGAAFSDSNKTSAKDKKGIRLGSDLS